LFEFGGRPEGARNLGGVTADERERAARAQRHQHEDALREKRDGGVG